MTNRIIKFRAWDGEKMWADAHEAYDYIEPSDEAVPATSFGELLKDKRWKVMQFTGLLDKNGKEIYEGDIIKMINGYNSTKDPQEDAMIHAVEWCEPYAMFGVHGMCFNLLNLFPREIIGNIYENPELLAGA